ncbi:MULTISPECIES: ABC transporter permease [Pseudonocardia]|uniref:Glutathione transport system permease protein GsiC n=2 Tax=Pseudonocardia TaxID=1847 RepID=A0A1Y2ML75_PSEAH|nr:MULTISPECIES: ABC transporter permease [Pseudonocardia]OSY35739.1 Glutathione transport system permease protein GsiC [Pseudonocardia autotrophica]TDN74569.1 peptide/nickel transport system permease protein [Pseudonocardia autotrophica]BBG05337.1 peptide ABC transporter permease [Pseudonocardia autotrophica]GEC27461.1 peptide ABC transporter permease [Pseudonocardia saturnea]
MNSRMVIRRIGGGLLVLWLVSLLTFLMVQLIPGDPAEVIAGDNASVADVDRIRAQLGLDRPVYEQYLSWLGGVLQGDLGNSLFTNQPVTQAILDVAPPTLALTLTAIILALLLGVGAGVIAGLRQGSWIDRAVSTLATLGIAMPSFWVAMLLVSVFALTLRWLPATTYVPLDRGFGTWLSHILIPATALGLATAAELARHTRGCVADVLARPYIRTARARGASTPHLIGRHVLRNAAIPVVTVLGLQTSRLIGGTIVIEAVVGISGLGSLAVNSVLQRDYPVIQGYVLFCALVVVVVNLVVDLAYGWINPKVRAA